MLQRVAAAPGHAGAKRRTPRPSCRSTVRDSPARAAAKAAPKPAVPAPATSTSQAMVRGLSASCMARAPDLHAVCMLHVPLGLGPHPGSVGSTMDHVPGCELPARHMVNGPGVVEPESRSRDRRGTPAHRPRRRPHCADKPVRTPFGCAARGPICNQPRHTTFHQRDAATATECQEML